MLSEVNPSLIQKHGFGFFASKVLLCAVKLELFTTLANGPMSGIDLQIKLSLFPRATYDFLDTLVALKLLDRDGDGPSAKYRNTPETALYLDKNKESYVGGILELTNDRLYRFWGNLDSALKTGKPQNEVRPELKPVFDELYNEVSRREQFMSGMTDGSFENFTALAQKFDFSKHKTLCDVGGGTGILSTLVAQNHTHIRCQTFDLPAVEYLARKQIEKNGMSDRVKVISGDFFKDPLPSADVITMGMILHDWNLQNKMKLIRAAYNALPEGGALISIENLIDDARRENAYGLMMSLTMLIVFGDGFDYSFADFKKWCAEVGFKKFELLHLAGPCSAAIAYK